MHNKPGDKFKVKKKIKINSLEAAICNVALFKSMKDKEFRDTIFISYCEEGVILEASSQSQWKKAHDHIENFLQNKKIQLLIDGFDKDEYQTLINKGLKQITRKIRQSDEQCPYINIIHYQKLRKSCEYMDKERYVDPLKDWQKKNKKNANFAFLIVEPKHRFEDIKRSLLEYLLNEPVPLKITPLQSIQLLYLLFFSPAKETIKNNCNRRQIEISVERDEEDEEPLIQATNYTNINLNEYMFSVVKGQSKLTKSGMGLEVITSAEIRQEIKNAKLYCRDNPTQVIERELTEIEQQNGQNFIIIPYRREQHQKYKTLLQKYSNPKSTKEQLQKKLQTHQIFNYEQIEFLEQVYTGKSYRAWKVCINSCPFMIYEYEGKCIDVDTFVIYLDQLQMFYCTYMIRYYGIVRRRKDGGEQGGYLLVFDYHRSSLVDMLDNDMILDSMQIATIILQLLYLINFLHSHDQPRCLGPIEARQIFWPMATILPYLGISDDETIYSIQNDVKHVGLLMKQLLAEEEDEECLDLIAQMTNPNKYERPSVKKCIALLEEMLCL